MAHKLLEQELKEPKPKLTKWLRMPSFNGKLGISLFLGTKEVFIGVCVGEVEIERIVRKKMIATPKAGVKVFRFD